jgi:hypothetical protein
VIGNGFTCYNIFLEPCDRFYATPCTKTQACNARLWGSLIHSKFQVTDIIALVLQSKSQSAFARSNTAIVGSSPARATDVYLRRYCVCVFLAAGWSPVRVLPSVYKIHSFRLTVTGDRPKILVCQRKEKFKRLLYLWV